MNLYKVFVSPLHLIWSLQETIAFDWLKILSKPAQNLHEIVYQIGLSAASDKVYQLLAHGRWFSLGTPASSTTKTGRHDIAEILLKVALNTKNQSINQITL